MKTKADVLAPWYRGLPDYIGKRMVVVVVVVLAPLPTPPPKLVAWQEPGAPKPLVLGVGAGSADAAVGAGDILLQGVEDTADVGIDDAEAHRDVVLEVVLRKAALRTAVITFCNHLLIAWNKGALARKEGLRRRSIHHSVTQ